MNWLVKIMIALICVYNANVFASEIAPVTHHVVLSVTMDKSSLPNQVDIFNNIFGGQTTPGSPGDSGMLNQNRWNSLTCLSKSTPTNGKCPTNPYWGNGITSPAKSNSLVLQFTQENTKKTVLLTLDGVRRRPPLSDTSLWNAAGNDSGEPITFSASIPRTELAKLTPGANAWKATLIMNLTVWNNNCSTRLQPDIGCSGRYVAPWTADITIKVTDYGTQQIYLPEFGSGTPVVDLGLRFSNSGTPNASATASRTVDMCLYDGSNSSSNQISLLFSDEGKNAPGRADGYFSLFTGNSTDSSKRLDYSLSVVNPLTGSPQVVKNGSEIVWTGVSADTGKVKTRLVSLPGVSGLAQCVPAPMTLTVPEFKISSKSPGKYSGTLRVVYTPTTQSFTDRPG